MREHPSVRRVVTLDEPFEDAVSAAEFLSAGVTVPTHDTAIPPPAEGGLCFASGDNVLQRLKS